MKEFVLMGIDLALFDGAAPAAPVAPEGGSQSTETGGSNEGTGDADQSEEVEVVYGKQAEEVETSEKAEEVEESEAGEQKEEGDPASETQDYDFETLLKTDESFKSKFDEKVQNIINKRFKETKQLEEKVERVDPVLDLLKERYGVEDTDTLLETLENETYEELAYNENMDPEQYKKMKQLERENNNLKNKMNTEETQQQVEERVQKWYDEAEKVKEDYPEFDLKEASKNEEFLRLLKSGVGVKAAFQATNFENILQQKLSAATEKAKSNAVENIRSGNNRVKENGAKNTPGRIVKSDPSSLSKEDRAEIARRVQNGEQIKF